MGFTTGLLGGATLTYSLLYLTLYLHKANRNAQHTILAQSSLLLNSIVEPLPVAPDPPAYEVRRAGLAEVLKDRWNREIEKMVDKVQTTDWNEQRELAEERIAAAWANLRQTEKVEELEQRFKENVVGVKEEAKEKVQELKERGKKSVDVHEPRLLELK